MVVAVARGRGVEATVLAFETPVSKSTTLRTMSFLLVKKPAASMLGSLLGAGGNISAWNESAFRGTTNAIGSIVPDEAEEVIL